MKRILYDATREKAKFDKIILKFERKLTKANQTGKLKKKEKLEIEASHLISERLSTLSHFEFGGYGMSTQSFKYNEKGEAKIFVEFKKENIVALTSAEVRELLGGRSLNKQQEVSKNQEECGMKVIIAASKNVEKTDNICGWDGGCSYDCLDCGCDEYYRGL